MPEQKAKTIDGAPTPRSSLNIDSPSVLKNQKTGIWAGVAKAYRRLNEVMSGMYTGVGCTGTPHQHHSYDEEEQSEKPKH